MSISRLSWLLKLALTCRLAQGGTIGRCTSGLDALLSFTDTLLLHAPSDSGERLGPRAVTVARTNVTPAVLL